MSGKKILVVGVGTQGSTIAKVMDKNPMVEQIICADNDKEAVDELVSAITKGVPAIIDATDKESVKKYAKDADILVNTLPYHLEMPSLEAAAEVGIDYQDFNAPTGGFEFEDFDNFYSKWEKIFADAGATAVFSTGVGPGLFNVMAKKAVRYLDSCEQIMFIYNEGLITKKYMPFWWNPVVAFTWMGDPCPAYHNGKPIMTEAFSGEIVRDYKELGKPVSFYEHGHSEPLTVGYFADKYYKGAKNSYFKYGGYGMEFAKPLMKLGLLSLEPMQVPPCDGPNYSYAGGEIIPVDLIVQRLPKSPKYEHEIKELIDSGIVQDNSCCVVEATGMIGDTKMTIESHLHSPGLEEAFERSGFSEEMYQTGICGATFTKMLVEGKFDRKGIYSPDMLTEEQVDCYLNYLSKEGHKVEIVIREAVEEDNDIVIVQ